jgi:hypothetical protein
MSDETKINKATDKAGLSFNVNTVKASMRKYYKDHDLLLRKTHGDDKKVVYESPQFSQSDVAVTALLQYICGNLVEEALKHTKKDKTNLKRIARSHLYQAVQMNPDLNSRFLLDLRKFDQTADFSYEDNVPVSSKELALFVATEFGEDVMLTPQAKNTTSCFVHMLHH